MKLNDVRLWLIAKLTKESEQYLINKAVEQRVNTIHQSIVMDKQQSPNDALDDINELRYYVRRFKKTDYRI